MATSGTFAFNLDIYQIIEEAYERCGIELKTGYQLTTAARSLDLLMTEWTNRGINLWTLDQTTSAIVADNQSITLDAKYVDVIDAVMRNSSNIDNSMNRITLSAYLNYPNKATTGQPSQYAVERNSNGGHTVYFYPAADTAYTMVSWTIRYGEDAGIYTNNAEVPRRFLPALVSGLAYYLANKNPAKYELDSTGRPYVTQGVDINRRQELLGAYDIDFTAAKQEDHERASLFIVPNIATI
jgi:hypothetical protein|tara:strand:- start:7899 stop:8618 length:720 start_codon:yes stop_codon:yes gene_type:complete